jgi:hypothetical protein
MSKFVTQPKAEEAHTEYAVTHVPSIPSVDSASTLTKHAKNGKKWSFSSLPACAARLETLYAGSFHGQQLLWMKHVAAASASRVAVVIGEVMGDRHCAVAPLVHVTVQPTTRTTRVSTRSAMTLGHKIAATVQNSQNSQHSLPCDIWVPVRICAPEELHSNALFIRVQQMNEEAFVTVHHYEPHGWAVNSGAIQDGCCFTNTYMSVEMEQSMREYLRLACETYAGLSAARWCYKPPSAWLPAAGPQTLSDVRGAGQGDSWCAFHTTWMLCESTRTSPETFVSRVQQAHASGHLRQLVISTLESLVARIHDPKLPHDTLEASDAPRAKRRRHA